MSTIFLPGATTGKNVSTAPNTSNDKFSSSKSREKIAFIDIIPSSLFVTPKTDQRLRECAKQVVDLLGHDTADVTFPQCPSDKKEKRNSDHCPHVQTYNNPLWWKYLPKFHNEKENEDDDTTPFVRSWKSILRLKRAYANLQSRYAVIEKLPVGFCPATKAIESKNGSELPVHLRLGVPTLDACPKHLIATPPSLPWALSVTVEFCRMQTADNKAENSNLTVETVGVLENWTEFFTYGSLLTDDSSKLCFDDKVWLRSNSTSHSERISCSPSPIIIVIDSGVESEEPPEKNAVVDEEKEQWRWIDEAWRNTVAAKIIEGSAIRVRGGSEEITEALISKIISLCHERLAV